MEQPLYVVFLWHMHQPYYKDLVSNEISMPWVRLHAIKDYFDMVKILESFPQVHQTFNLVPSLIEQLTEYAEDKDCKDKFFIISEKLACELTEEEKYFILLNFFMANWDTMVKPYPRFYDLLIKRGKYTTPAQISEIVKRFTVQDFLDLQVWFNLCWFDPYFKDQIPELKSLLQKGANFTEQDKKVVLEKQLEIIRQILPIYKQFQNSGQIEVSVSPYYHPILPLLCNTEIAKESYIYTELPTYKFSHPEDADIQIKMAVDCYKKYFNKPPAGMWPSEGAVAEAILPLIIKNSINWIASDEEILFKSLKESKSADLLYKPYILKRESGSLNIIFRDKTLSDNIGFIYYNWPQELAVNDFLAHLDSIRTQFYKDKPVSQKTSLKKHPPLVSLILDGENAWEYYKNDGRDFLLLLYERLNNHPYIKCTTVSEYLNQFPPEDEIEELYPGSWINANFNIWIGHREKNQAWDALFNAKDELDKFIEANPDKKDTPEIKLAQKEIFIAEGSDWNWWYGDNHSSSFDEEFDRLFRQHLMNVYEIIGKDIPDTLKLPIKSVETKPLLEPGGLVKPIIDGKDTNYYEWLAAGFLDVSKLGGTMHRTESIIRRLFYGFDLENLYIRLDIGYKTSTENLKDINIVFLFQPYNLRLEIPFNITNTPAHLVANLLKKQNDHWIRQKDIKGIVFDKIFEMAVGFGDLNLKQGNEFSLLVLIERQGLILEKVPQKGPIKIKVPPGDYESYYWNV